MFFCRLTDLTQPWTCTLVAVSFPEAKIWRIVKGSVPVDVDANLLRNIKNGAHSHLRAHQLKCTSLIAKEEKKRQQ